MTEAQAQARHQARVEELCAATIRALTGEADLHFRSRRLHRGAQALPLHAPHLHPAIESDDFASFRGAADGLALRLANSNAALHRRLAPEEALERLLFDMLEQFRAEALLPAAMPGLARNLRHRHETWSLGVHDAGLTENARGLLIYTVAQICRARVSGEQVVEATEDRLEATRGALGPLLGTAFAGLRRTRFDQAAYAVHALEIARTVASMLHRIDDDATDERRDEHERDDRRRPFQFWQEFDGNSIDGVEAAGSSRSDASDAGLDDYRIFTTAYDRKVRAASLVRPALLKEQRAQLDLRIAEHGLNAERLARQLRVLLAVPAHDGWDGAQEEGQIDGRRLAQLIASPSERRLFRTEREQPVADCLVSFLIDCSGSMKQHIEAIAMLVDVFVRALDQAGASSEILGFTTGAWNGGRARRDWLRSGRPAAPGRLNEACHLVFKDAATPWRRARADIAALLKTDLFREGIDGEAIDWACRRLEGRDERRRILVVISDGSPMDSATSRANDDGYLERHLREVVDRHRDAGSVAIYGVGVGADLSPFYRLSRALDLAALASNQSLREIAALITGPMRR